MPLPQHIQHPHKLTHPTRLISPVRQPQPPLVGPIPQRLDHNTESRTPPISRPRQHQGTSDSLNRFHRFAVRHIRIRLTTVDSPPRCTQMLSSFLRRAAHRVHKSFLNDRVHPTNKTPPAVVYPPRRPTTKQKPLKLLNQVRVRLVKTPNLKNRVHNL